MGAETTSLHFPDLSEGEPRDLPGQPFSTEVEAGNVIDNFEAYLKPQIREALTQYNKDKLSNPKLAKAEFGSTLSRHLLDYLEWLDLETTPAFPKRMRQQTIDHLNETVNNVKQALAEIGNTPQEVINSINGIFAEHAVAEAFHSTGAKVHLATKEQDTLYKVDLWVRLKGSDIIIAVQVKSFSFKTRPPEFIYSPTSEQEILAIEHGLAEHTNHWERPNLHIGQLLSVQRIYGDGVVPLLITVPSPSSSREVGWYGYNEFTGEPSPDLESIVYNYLN